MKTGTVTLGCKGCVSKIISSLEGVAAEKYADIIASFKVTGSAIMTSESVQEVYDAIKCKFGGCDKYKLACQNAGMPVS